MKKLVLAILVSLLVLSACVQAETDPDLGTGYFSAQSVNVSAEMSGKVAEVFAQEGQEVEAGELLFKLDDAFLQGQKTQAEAALQTAQSSLESVKVQLQAATLQHELALDAAHANEIPARMQAWGQKPPTDYRPVWYFNEKELLAAAQANLDEAVKDLELKTAALEAEIDKVGYAGFAGIEQKLAEDEMAWQLAEQTLAQAKTSGNADLQDAAQQAADDAETNFKSSLSKYENALSTKDAEAIIQKRSQLAVAQSQVDFAQDQVLKLETGDQSGQVQLALSAKKQAEVGLVQAESGVKQAEAALNLINLQLERSEVKSPISGTVTAANLKAGEIVTAGSIAIVVAPLDELNLEVYMPETYYGQVKLGDSVKITADSFPNQEFTGTVTKIADQAEFSPRNLQTVENRSSSVYKISITVPNAGKQFKPGMPADVRFK